MGYTDRTHRECTDRKHTELQRLHTEYVHRIRTQNAQTTHIIHTEYTPNTQNTRRLHTENTHTEYKIYAECTQNIHRIHSECTQKSTQRIHNGDRHNKPKYTENTHIEYPHRMHYREHREYAQTSTGYKHIIQTQKTQYAHRIQYKYKHKHTNTHRMYTQTTHRIHTQERH